MLETTRTKTAILLILFK